MTAELNLDTIEIIDPGVYARDGYPHESWRFLRREAPIYRWDRPGTSAFWAVTRRADILWLSKQPERFQNGPRLAVFPQDDLDSEEEDEDFTRHLLNMDPPDHGAFRKIASGWFTPRAIRRRHAEITRITRDLLDGLGRDGQTVECDFVSDFTAPLTLSVLADMLGVAREDWRLMFQWTNAVAGAGDPEFSEPDETPFETVRRAQQAMFAYFAKLAETRRAEPRDDIVSVIANARIGGEPLPPLELLSYFFLLVVAGNETTRNAASGGLLELIRNPGELEKLRRNPALIDPAVEEIVRWTSPVIQFCRTAVEDVEIRGQKIRAGENLCLFYPSANRDEEVFDDPDVFRVDRKPNPHIGFGIGEHFCLGANLARLELREMLSQIVARADEIELAGEPERVQSSFLGGVKRMPIRWRLRPQD